MQLLFAMLPASGVVYLLVGMSFEYTIYENFKLQKTLFLTTPQEFILLCYRYIRY